MFWIYKIAGIHFQLLLKIYTAEVIDVKEVIVEMVINC